MCSVKLENANTLCSFNQQERLEAQRELLTWC